MKKTIILLGALMMHAFAILGQTSETRMLSTIPQESVYVQYNESLLFSGESLLYKVYCLDRSNRQLTQISKIAYVSLVDSEGKAVFTHKIKLNKGSGYGDFFVPTSVPTGSYKLIGYSQWMKNFGADHFFQADIHIINPYQVPPEAYVEKTQDSTQTNSNAPFILPSTKNIGDSDQNGRVQLTLDKTVLSKREKLVLKISTSSQAFEQGNYGLSVRRLDAIVAPKQISSESFMGSLGNGLTNSKIGKTFSLPELRGEIVSGTLMDKETKQPVANVRVSLSLPGDDFLFNVANTDADGKFRFIIDQEYDNITGALQILAEDWDRYEINMDQTKIENKGIQVTDFKLSEGMKDLILQKSIQNQIENGFSDVKSDSVIPAHHDQPYYRNFTASYDLDDYTRFNSIQETIVEVVDQVSVRRTESGERFFEIRPALGFTNLALRPMVFVDGLFIKRHEDFMDFSAKKIKNISFSRNKVILGSQVFQGVLSFSTIEGGFYNDFYTPHIVNLDLFKPQPNKQYFTQSHAQAQPRVPDFRHQLLWEPKLDLSKGSEELILYASDVTGTYELVLEGFSSKGNPVSISRTFKVE